MSDGKHTIVTVDGAPLDLSDPEPRMSERLPPGDCLSWVKEGDTVTMEDLYGYTAYATVTQVVAPEESNHDQDDPQ